MNFVIARTGPDVTVATTPADCATGGIITVTTTGVSAAPYQFFINGVLNPAGANNPVFRNLQGGIYDIIVSGANNYRKDEQVIVDGWMNEMEVTGQVNAQTGNIDVTVTNGSGDYTYLWSTNATTQDVAGLPDGNYWVDVTDVNIGCTMRKTFVITRTNNTTITFTLTNAACGANGIILVNLSQGNPADYSFSINGQTNPAGAHDPAFRNLAPGAYIVRVTGPANFDNTQTVNLGGTPNNLRIIGTADEDGNINITVSGGSGNYQYLWSDKSTTEDLHQRPPGTYTVTVTDAVSGCTAKFTILVAASRSRCGFIRTRRRRVSV